MTVGLHDDFIGELKVGQMNAVRVLGQGVRLTGHLYRGWCASKRYICFLSNSSRWRADTLDMKPRQLLPGSSYLITRRCTQRQFLLHPSPLTNQIVRYCVAFAAERYGIEIHSMCVLSNHWHLVATDPAGMLPRFLQWVHEYVAKCVNASCGRWENMWSSEATSVVRLEADEDVIDKIVYCLANPVSAGLVAHGHKWPGARSSAMDLVGTSYEVERPPVFFRDDGPMPAVATLRFSRPGVCLELSADDLAGRVADLLAEREAAVRDEHARAGVPFLRIKGIRRQRRTDRPTTSAPRRKLSPQIAAKDRGRRLAAIARLKAFQDAYRAALMCWRQGVRDVLFPAGTYAMRVAHGAACVALSP